MKVQLLDLKAQYATIKEEVNAALIRVAESQYFILGPEVKKLEETVCNYIGCKYAIGVSSGTDALLIALMAAGIQAGDEVIMPTYSFFATAGVVARLNAVPVFTDIDPVTFNIDVNDIEKRISSKTKAIIPVHLYGQACDMDAINIIAKKHNLKVIEDGAQAIGVDYKSGRVGTLGDIGCFSFFPSKNLGAFGDGGVVTTNDEELGERLRIMRVHGSKPKYYHKMIGGNFRLDEIQAAVLNVKFPYLDRWSEKRRENAALYNDKLSEILRPQRRTQDDKQYLNSKEQIVNSNKEQELKKHNLEWKDKIILPKAVYKDLGLKNYHIYNQYVIMVEKRNELQAFLKENDVATEIYYPVPFHKQECFAYLKADGYPNADYAAEHSLALPIYPELTLQQINFVSNKILEFVNV